MERLTPEVRASLVALIDYLWFVEANDWHALGRPAAHIFRDVHCVAEWLIDEAYEA